ncbi:MAG: hypothetical protein RJA07_2389 [Bacteroidota bacterium]|jgi:hypothetical protein
MKQRAEFIKYESEQLQLANRYGDLIRKINGIDYRYNDCENSVYLFNLAISEYPIEYIPAMLPKHLLVRLLRLELGKLITKVMILNISQSNKDLLQIVKDELPNTSTSEQFQCIIEQIIVVM